MTGFFGSSVLPSATDDTDSTEASRSRGTIDVQARLLSPGLLEDQERIFQPGHSTTGPVLN